MSLSIFYDPSFPPATFERSKKGRPPATSKLFILGPAGAGILPLDPPTFIRPLGTGDGKRFEIGTFALTNVNFSHDYPLPV